MSRFRGRGGSRDKVTAWDRQQKPAGLNPTNDPPPIPVSPHLVRRHFKRDALRQDRAVGCRCRNVKARTVPPPPDAEEGTISVVTWPHQPGCPIYTVRAQAESTRRIEKAIDGSSWEYTGPTPRSSPDAAPHPDIEAPSVSSDLTVIEEKKELWVPGAE